jgi:aspartate carbamoyltransferase regulatory subunit
MRIQLRCPNGHTEIINDMRHISTKQKLITFTKHNVHCFYCDELIVDSYELIEVKCENGM